MDSELVLTSRHMQAVQRMALDRALTMTVDSFNARHVSYVLLKGPAFARWLYEDEGARTYRDIDLLVRPDDFPASREAMTELGFREVSVATHPTHHDAWLNDSGVPTWVEVHRSLSLLSADPVAVWEALASRADEIELVGIPVAVPSAEASALIVALHAAQHGVRTAKSMEDLRRALDRVDLTTWRKAAEIARALDTEGAFAVGLCLEPKGRAVAERLGLSLDTSRLVRLHAATPPDTSVGIERLIVTPGAVSKLRLLGQELVPAPTFMRGWQPLARRGRWGLVVAYLWRPAWLLAKLPRGIRAWRAASRATDGSGPRRPR